MALDSDLGARMLERRLALGMSQRQLAGVEVSPSYVSLIEAGKRRPTANVLAVLAERLQISPSALATGADTPAHGLERIDLELKWARIALRAGDPAAAERSARPILSSTDCTPSQLVEAKLIVASAAEAAGRLDEAIDIVEPLRDELDSDRSREQWRACQLILCRCYKDVGDLGHAIDLGERALASSGVMTDEEVMLAVSLSDAYLRRGDVHRAGRLLSNILTRAEVAGSHQNQGAALWNASLVAEADDRLVDAVKLAERALALFSESDAVRNLGRLRVTYAFLLREESTDSVPVAREQLRRAHLEFELEGSVIERARCLSELARCALDEDDVPEGLRLLDQASAVVDDGPAIERAKVELVRGHAMVRSGRVEDGLRTASAAARVIDEQSNSPRDTAQAWRELAALARMTGNHDLVMDALERAVDVMGLRPARVGRTAAQPVVALTC